MGYNSEEKQKNDMIDSIINLVKENDNTLLQLYIIHNFYDSVYSSINNSTDLNIQNLAKQLASFCLSEKFFIYLVGELKEEYNKTPCNDFIALYETKEKYLSLKVFFYLIEELKKKNLKTKSKKYIDNIKTSHKNLQKVMICISKSIKNLCLSFAMI